MAEILARAKMAPLHLEADVTMWMPTQVEHFARQVEAHISHTCHLNLSGYGYFESALARLSSSAPTLESLFLSHISPTHGSLIIPDNLFNCTTPNLTNLKLESCDISWKSPLLKNLRTLEILDISTKARPGLEDWLDALNEMPKLKKLSLHSATPRAPPFSPHISEPSRTITLPSLTHFYIRDFAKDCALALAHLLLPTLTWLHVDVKSHDREGEDVRLVIPYVVRNVYVLQDIEPIRSILIAGERTCAEVLTWTMPGADVKVCGLDTLDDMSRSACLMFAAKGNMWNCGVDTAIFDALLTLLPMNFVSTLTAQNCTRLSKESWLRHASRLPSLEQARLVPTAVRAFREMLVEDIPPEGLRLPSLTRLFLIEVALTALRTFHHLHDLVIKRVEQGVPMEVLDLHTCSAPGWPPCAIQFPVEIVGDVQEPLDVRQMAKEEFFKVGIGYCDEVEYDDGRRPWYGIMNGGEDEDQDERVHDDPFFSGDYIDEGYEDIDEEYELYDDSVDYLVQ